MLATDGILRAPKVMRIRFFIPMHDLRCQSEIGCMSAQGDRSGSPSNNCLGRHVIGAPKSAPPPFLAIGQIYFHQKSLQILFYMMDTLRSNKKSLHKPGWPCSDFLMLFMHFLACQIFEHACTAFLVGRQSHPC